MKIFIKAIKATVVLLWRIDKIKSTGVLLGGIGTFFGVVAIRRTFKPVANAHEESGNICSHEESEISGAEEIGSYLYYRDGGWSTNYKPIKPGDASYLASGLFGLATAYFSWCVHEDVSCLKGLRCE